MADFGASSYHLNLNDPDVLENLLRTYAQPLIRYAYTLLGSTAAAEDAMEDAFAALLVKGGKFDCEQTLRFWLYKTTRNRALDYLRRHKKEVPLEDPEQILHTWDVEEDLLLRRRNQQLYACMQALPRQYRDVLELHYFEDLNIGQIGIVLRKSDKQIYNLLSRAKASLKERLLKEGITCEDLR